MIAQDTNEEIRPRPLTITQPRQGEKQTRGAALGNSQNQNARIAGSFTDGVGRAASSPAAVILPSLDPPKVEVKNRI